MIRKFCDACDKEMADQTSTHVGIEVYVQKKGQRAPFYAEHSGNTPHYDICKYCIIDAFKKLDDREMDDTHMVVPLVPTEHQFDTARLAVNRRAALAMSRPVVEIVWGEMLKALMR